MRMFRFFGFLALLATLAACGGRGGGQWNTEYGNATSATPAQLQYGGQFSTSDNSNHKIAVLLPMTGTNATAGKSIQTGIEMAILQRAPENLDVAFFDTAVDANSAIYSALDYGPEIIIGPMFAANARILRDAKPGYLPVLSFTSDATAIGDGVMTMALMPTNSIELIVREMANDGTRNMIAVAPDTQSGYLMAGAALAAAREHGVQLNGIFYYTERDTESIKNAMYAASMNAARTTANTRAREILSDILTTETITAVERSNMSRQLRALSKTDVAGKLPYDAVLFLGGGDDTKSLASFLRYYSVGAREVKFYGTAMWDGSDIANDLTMTGAKFAALPDMNTGFTSVYTMASDAPANRLATFGYDATNMAIGMIYSSVDPAEYLMNPSGYVGMDGLVRIISGGESQRGLRILEIDGNGGTRTVRSAPTNFMTPIYNLRSRDISPTAAIALQSSGISGASAIDIPSRFRTKYRGGTARKSVTTPTQQNVVTVINDDTGPAIENPNYIPAVRESIGRKYIDSVEIYE